MTATPTPSNDLEVLHRAASQAGLDAEDASLLGNGTNAVYLLPPIAWASSWRWRTVTQHTTSLNPYAKDRVPLSHYLDVVPNPASPQCSVFG